MRVIYFFLLSIVCIAACKEKESLADSGSSIVEMGSRIVRMEVDCGSKAHFRGIQAVTDEVVWISGTGGTVVKTEDGGFKWKDVTVPDCETLDFRDIHALDKKRAWVMSSGNGVRIYYTDNGGKKWVLQFEDKNPKVFLDGMDFFDDKNGIVYGDPINGVMDVLMTSDGGLNWKRVEASKLPRAMDGEAGFAASGTGVVHHGNNIWMATGGGELSRIIKSTDAGESWEVKNTPIEGGEGAGIFSMAFKDESKGVVVGGNYIDSTNVDFNCAYTIDGGETWSLVKENGPRGYRSCVTIMESGRAFACGRTGIDKSEDFISWQSVSDEGYFTCDGGKEWVWFAGRRGKVMKMQITQ